MATATSAAVASLVVPVEIVNPACKAARSIAAPKAVLAAPARSLAIRASAEQDAAPTSSRRSLLNLVAAAVAAGAFASSAQAVTSVKIEAAPPLSGGLPGTLNADQARDVDLPLNERFFLQKLSSADASKRVKQAVEDIVSVKSSLDKKAWTEAREGLRIQASYLRFDLAQLVKEKSTDKASKKSLEGELKDVLRKLEQLDYAARSKSPADSEKYYAEAVTSLKAFVSKIA